MTVAAPDLYPWTTPEHLFEYALLNSRSESHLFFGRDLLYLLQLAGEEERFEEGNIEADGLISLGPGIVESLVEAARRKIGSIPKDRVDLLLNS